MKKYILLLLLVYLSELTLGQCTAVSVSSQPQNQTANAGGTATFSVTASGTAPFLYFWYKNNVFITGATSSTYTTPTLTASDNGNTYKCIITNCNSLNQVTSNNATLTVNSQCTAVSVSSQPQNQTANVGSTPTFSVFVAGTSPYTYQWRKNGSNIIGANSSSYKTNNLMLSDNGNLYSCRITNCNGVNNVISSNATLTVTNLCVG
ncbi:MAG: immunoglobulin domain-containing protein, partial [Saprospiraceae bacterium]